MPVMGQRAMRADPASFAKGPSLLRSAGQKAAKAQRKSKPLEKSRRASYPQLTCFFTVFWRPYDASKRLNTQPPAKRAARTRECNISRTCSIDEPRRHGRRRADLQANATERSFRCIGTSVCGGKGVLSGRRTSITPRSFPVPSTSLISRKGRFPSTWLRITSGLGANHPVRRGRSELLRSE